MNGFVRLDYLTNDAPVVKFELLSVGVLLQQPSQTHPAAETTCNPPDAHPNLHALQPDAQPPVAVIGARHRNTDFSKDESVHSHLDPESLQHTELLGEGSFARVWKALYSKADGTARTVAVKRLRPEALLNTIDRIHFVAEARLLKKLKHKSIVELLGMGRLEALGPTAADSMFLVQEYVCGGTLKRLVQSQMLLHPRRVYTYGQGLRWMLHVAEGLAYLHTRNPVIIHRDLKLDNILLTSTKPEEAEAKITDLGLHTQVGSWVHQVDHSSNSLPRLQSFFSVPPPSDSSNHGKRLVQLSSPEICALPTGSAPLSSDPPAPSTPAALPATEGAGKLPPRHSNESQPVSAKLAAVCQAEPCPGPEDSASDCQGVPSQRGGGGGDGRQQRWQVQRVSVDEPRILSGRTGSLMYMAPEVFEKRQYSHKADIFSFGVMLHEVLHGHLHITSLPLHRGHSALEAHAHRIAAGHRPDVHRRFPPAIHNLISRCWQQDPAMRPEAAEVVQLLCSILASPEVQKLDARRPAPACCTIS